MFCYIILKLILFKIITFAKFVPFSAYFEKKICSINILSITYVNMTKYILKYRSNIILIGKDYESIEGDPIIIVCIFTVVANK